MYADCHGTGRERARQRRSRSHRRGAAALLATVLTLTGCGAVDGHGAVDRTVSSPASSSPSGSGTGTPKAHFTDCSTQFNLGVLTFPTGRRDRLQFDCADVRVPLDYAKPSGATATLKLVRIHDRNDTKPAGTLLMNPGGPGGSGIELALSLSARLSDSVVGHLDLLGFDPRGVNLSTPSIRCLSDAQKDALNAASPDVRTPAGFQEAKQEAASVAKACSARYGKSLADFDTVQTAKDMEQIRIAVGDQQMNYLGFSYGTELGAQYAHLYPGRIRAMVLDGAVDPLTSDVAAFANQLQGFEGAFDQFASWCRSHSPCSSLGDARKAVYAITAKARRAPIASSAPGETRKATSALVLTGVLSALYSQGQWPSLAQALIGARSGNSAGLLALADEYNQRFHGRYSNISDANTTINCNDSRPGPSDATIRATTASWIRRFPMFGLWAAPSLFSCQQWQPDRTVPPLPTAPTAAHTVLVIGNLHDPATPYLGAKDLAHTLGKARLLTWDGEGHTSYLQGSTTCIDPAVDTYLVTGALPPAGKTCPR